MSMPVYIETKRGDPTYINYHNNSDSYKYEFPNKKAAVQPNQILLLLDGKFSDSWFGFISNDNVYVPIKSLSKLPGTYVTWDKNNRQVNITSNNSRIIIFPDKKTALVNNSEITLDFEPYIIEEHVYVSHFFVKSYFNFKTGFLKSSDQNAETGIAKNPIVYIDSYDAGSKLEKLRTDTLFTLQDTLYASYQSFKLMSNGKPVESKIKNVDEFMKDKISGMRFIGLIGRYAVYRWSGTILYDVEANNIFVYQHGKNISSMVRHKKDTPDIFFYEYFYNSDEEVNSHYGN